MWDGEVRGRFRVLGYLYFLLIIELLYRSFFYCIFL